MNGKSIISGIALFVVLLTVTVAAVFGEERTESSAEKAGFMAISRDQTYLLYHHISAVCLKS